MSERQAANEPTHKPGSPETEPANPLAQSVADEQGRRVGLTLRSSTFDSGERKSPPEKAATPDPRTHVVDAGREHQRKPAT